jgi:3-isopropylmalate dehydrogenase
MRAAGSSIAATRSLRNLNDLRYENMLGDILSDLAGELAGSLGLAGAVNAGDVTAMAQATHGAAPDIAGQGIANPVGMIRSTALLLRWLGERRGVAALTAIAGRIEAAVARTLSAGQVRTPDLGGRATSRELAAAIADAARRS